METFFEELERYNARPLKEPTKMLLCRDCQFYRPGPQVSTHCDAPQNNMEPDYITGGTRAKWFSANACRDDNEACSPAGKWFRARIVAVQT